VSEEQGATPKARTVGGGALRLSKRVVRGVHRAAHAHGAGPSGLAALIGTHALNAAGDALVAVALASTAFFDVSASQARGKIALYLILTLLPFSLLILVAGPLLDRFPHGRRNVLAVTSGGRGLVTWTLATSLASLALYPQALAILVLQRAYGVARAAAVVRVQPPELGLVASNARLQVASLASSGIAAALGVAISQTVGTAWVLRVATLLFLVAGATSLRLPSRIDEYHHKPERGAPRPEPFAMSSASTRVRRALVATVSLRTVIGLLTLGLAILLKAHHAAAPVVGLILGAAVGGGLVGTALASHLPSERTARLTAIALLAPTIACLLAAFGGTTMIKAFAVLSVGLGASLGKYALDAALQTTVAPTQISGAFARSETMLQLGWAAGGALGLGLSMFDRTGLGASGATSVLYGVATVIAVTGLLVARRWSRVPPRHSEGRAAAEPV
jgi:MFS family permease